MLDPSRAVLVAAAAVVSVASGSRNRPNPAGSGFSLGVARVRLARSQRGQGAVADPQRLIAEAFGLPGEVRELTGINHRPELGERDSEAHGALSCQALPSQASWAAEPTGLRASMAAAVAASAG